MGRGRKGSGVEVRDNSIRVNFTWNDERCRETLDDLLPTPPNVKYATRLMAQIRKVIAAGTFKYADYFPNSPRVAQDPERPVSIEERGKLWLASRGRLASATRSQYGNALAFWYELLGGAGVDIKAIRHGDLAAKIGGYAWPSPKLCNNYLIPLRGMFALSVRDKVIAEDPMNGIESSEMQDPLPDPFTMDEAEAILADMLKHYHEQIYNYFEVAFFAAPRPEEEIALLWGDMDWDLAMVRVQRARSFRGEVKPVKGYKARDVELLARPLEAIRRQKAYTFMKESGHIFENPVTDRPWHDERSQRDHYWTPTLKRLGIRYRRPYCTRHTFATLAIMGDCNPTWVARQMGNSPRVIYKHYAKWIEQADKSRQKNKLEAVVGPSQAGQFVPNLSPVRQNTGRRDWNRTSALGDSKGKKGNVS